MIKTCTYNGVILHISLYKNKPMLKITNPATQKEALVGITTVQYYGDTPYVTAPGISSIRGNYLDVKMPRYKSVLDAVTAAYKSVAQPPQENIYIFFNDLL